MSIEELLRPPDYEIRANNFISRVQGIGNGVKEAYEWTDCLFLTVEDALEKWTAGFERVGELLGDRNLPRELDPVAIADGYDRQSASCSVVEVNASCTSWEPLKKFIDQTLDLAHEQGGEIDEGFLPISTEKKEDMIKRINVDSGETWFNSNLFFKFK